jgi:hypothetical protein
MRPAALSAKPLRVAQTAGLALKLRSEQISPSPGKSGMVCPKGVLAI